MFWIIVGVVVVCAVCSMADSAEETAKADKARALEDQTNTANARQSRIITSFQALLCEEFPDHAASITFATANQSYQAYTQTFTDPALRHHFTWYDKNTFKSPDAQIEVRNVAVARAGAVVSQDFQNLLVQSPDQMDKYLRAYQSAPTRAG